MKVSHFRESGKHGPLIKTKIKLSGKERGIECVIPFVGTALDHIWEFKIPNGRTIEEVIIKFKQ